MSANRPKNTKPELTLRKALYHAGHRGYRINYRIQFQPPAVQKPARSKATDRNPLLTKEGWPKAGVVL